MPPAVLILSEPTDLHAHAVAIALRQRRAKPVLWYTSDFPSRACESVLYARGEERFRVDGIDPALLTTRQFSSIWRRRPAHVLDDTQLHHADRPFAESECAAFRQSMLSILLPDRFWVNPQDAALRAGRKLVQHRCAIAAGLAIPDTLFSNDPHEIRNFIQHHPEGVVYKPLRPFSWRREETRWTPYTALVNEESLVDPHLLRATPGIFQALVPKAYELRATVMGNRLFGAKLHSQDTAGGKLDWRMAYDELRMEPEDLPPDVAQGCLRLMRDLGIVFGCFDLIVTPKGDHVFLEVNEMGQFLFIEQLTGLPLLDAFSEFLIQGRTDFAWSAGETRIRYSDIRAEAITWAERAAAEHVLRPERAVDEGMPRPPEP